MKLTVNGEERETDTTTVLAFLNSLEIHPRTVVVEFNLEILPRNMYGEQELRDGDQLEIVQMMAGG